MMQATAIDLTAFCGDSLGRFKLGDPWTVGEYTYATDGHVAVRVPACVPMESDAESARWRPKAEGLPVWPKEGEQLDFQPLPFIDVENLIACDRCDGKKVTQRVTCTDCNGEGEYEHESPNGYEYRADCKCCDGKGSVFEPDAKFRPCEECKRTGWSLKSGEDHSTSIAGRHYSAVQLLRFANLPDLKYHVRLGGALLLKFDGGYGALMPLSKESRGSRR